MKLVLWLMQINGMVLEEILRIAVSYTHLDVYKRQKIDSLENSVDTLKAEKEALNTNIKEIRPVSYTHLCR